MDYFTLEVNNLFYLIFYFSDSTIINAERLGAILKDCDERSDLLPSV